MQQSLTKSSLRQTSRSHRDPGKDSKAQRGRAIFPIARTGPPILSRASRNIPKRFGHRTVQSSIREKLRPAFERLCTGSVSSGALRRVCGGVRPHRRQRCRPGRARRQPSRCSLCGRRRRQGRAGSPSPPSLPPGPSPGSPATARAAVTYWCLYRSM
jgi:hypothetical protein